MRSPALRLLPAKLSLYALAQDQVVHGEAFRHFLDPLSQRLHLGCVFVVCIRLKVVVLHDDDAWQGITDFLRRGLTFIFHFFVDNGLFLLRCHCWCILFFLKLSCFGRGVCFGTFAWARREKHASATLASLMRVLLVTRGARRLHQSQSPLLCESHAPICFVRCIHIQVLVDYRLGQILVRKGRSASCRSTVARDTRAAIEQALADLLELAKPFMAFKNAILTIATCCTASLQ
mmetsp:Transcript_32135/g.39848  ORF Transcript_32135/g.39848 Transcript_32135/m.39848 type:complete len:233 (-) Transcript_32135:591-1289(-)